jgi:hypothetical protein
MDNLGGSFFGARVIQPFTPAVDLVFNGLGEAAGIAFGQSGVAKEYDHPLVRLTWHSSIIFNELEKQRDLDLLGADKRVAKMAGKIEMSQKHPELNGRLRSLD